MSDLCPDLFPGDVVANSYRIKAAIGIGGSGTVYRAQRVGMTQEVALKVMHSEHPDSAAERQRFAREAEMVKRLQHPHVVPLLDYGHAENGIPFLVFALLTGQSLEEKIKGEGPLGWHGTARCSDQVLRALDHAHSLHIVHRDIKPANIFMSSGMLGEVVQVLDFGLAKVVGKGAKMDVTVAGSLLGTPRYMAPEQVRGEELGQAADIYSFGLVMAEMLLGRPLVDARTELEIFALQGSDVPLPIPVEVQASPFGPIIERAVSKAVSVRYRLANQMLADLRAAMAHIGECPDDDQESADLEATAIIDPNNLPFGLVAPTNPTAEKLRRVFNTMAGKAADAQAPIEPEQAPAPMPPVAPVAPAGPAAPEIEFEDSVEEYPESWTGPQPDRAAAEIEFEDSVEEYPESWTGPQPDREGFNPGTASSFPPPSSYAPPASAPFRSAAPQASGIDSHRAPPLSFHPSTLPPSRKSNVGLVIALVIVLLALVAVAAFGAHLLGLVRLPLSRPGDPLRCPSVTSVAHRGLAATQSSAERT